MVKSFNKSKNVKWNRITVGVITFIIILIFNYLFQVFPSFYKTVYLKGLFQVIRIIHDYTLGLLPIPTIYLLVPSYFGYFLWQRMSSFKSIFMALLASTIWIVNLFYLLWGFNYTQPSIYTQLSIEPVSLDSTYIKNEFINQSKILTKHAAHQHDPLETTVLENTLRVVQEKLIKSWDTPTIGKVRIRSLPPGALLSIRTSGIYIPHAIEGHFDSGLYYKQHPFTMAHEMAHGYGFTDESVCNFIAYLTCQESENELIKYSAELAYWRYLAKYYKYYYPAEWEELYANLDPNILSDLKAIRKHIEKYKDLMPEMRDVLYDKYLKTHGVKAGIKSYDEMIQLIAAYKMQKK